MPNLEPPSKSAVTSLKISPMLNSDGLLLTQAHHPPTQNITKTGKQDSALRILSALACTIGFNY